MRIYSLRIKGFKSIDEIELNDIPSFMVLAGANGSGKSNFVDALAFLGELIRTNLNHAVEQFHGMDFICNRNFEKHNNNILLCVVGNTGVYDFYYFIICSVEEKVSKIIGEQFSYFNEDGNKISIKKGLAEDDIFSTVIELESELLSIEELTKIKKNELANSENIEIKYNITSDILKLNQEYMEKSNLLVRKRVELQESMTNNISILGTIREAKPLVDFLANIQVFRIDPVQAKTPSLQGSTSKLLPNGSNIADILEKHQSDPEFREELMEWLEMIVPNLSFVQAEKRQIDTSSVLRFQEGEHTFPAGLISDGTIYTLCILTAILSRSPQHGITIIEEPERGIHPQAIGELIALMREKAQDKHNIILTTHSEAVVRNLELEELYLVHKENGQTIINDVKNSGVDKRQIPLDEAWLTNSFNGGLPW